jgi:hypothetical protein
LCHSLSLGLALALLLGSLPNPAAAYDRIRITPEVSVQQLYDSNVFNTESDEDSDLATAVSPSVELNLQNDRTRLDFSYNLRSTHYVDYSDLNAVDHRVFLSGSRLLTHRLTLFGGANYLHLPKGDDVMDNDLRIKSGRNEFTSYSANGGLRYALDRVSNVSLSFFWSQADQTASDDVRPGLLYDPETLALTLAWNRSLSARDSVGASLIRRESTFSPEPDSFLGSQLVQQEAPGTLPDCPKGFDGPLIVFGPPGELGFRQCSGSISVPDNESSTTSLSANWSRIWSPRWSSELALGYTRVDTKQGSNSFSPSYSMNGVLSVTRRTRSSELTVSYSKFNRPSTAEGTEVDVDSAQISFRRSLTRRLGTQLRATWSRTTSASDFDSGLDSEVVTLTGLLHWRLTEHLSTFLSLSYRNQDASGSRAIETTGFENRRAILGFRYSKPITLY